MTVDKRWLTGRHLTALAILALAMAWGFLPEFTVVVMTYIGLYSLVAVGLVMLTGVGGMASFGQAAFVGIGAYATAWVCTSPMAVAALGGIVGEAGLPWVGLLLGLVLTFAVAWTLGAVTVKLSGHYLPLCTIAWSLSLYYLFGNMDFLGGQTGITGVPPLVIAGVSLASPRALGIAVWAALLVGLWLLHNLLDSREGRAIRALKGGRLMAESMGVDTAHYRVKLFVLAALMAAISGWFYAHMQRFVNPTPFNLNIGIEYLFMAVVGGSGHLWGAVLGATVITLLKEKLQDVLPSLLGTSGNFEVIVFGLLMVLVLQRFADGLWPTLGRLAQQGSNARQKFLNPYREQRGHDGLQGRRDPCAHRTQRGGEEHLLQRDLGRRRSDRRRGSADGPHHADATFARLRRPGFEPHFPARATARPAQRGRERGARCAPPGAAWLGCFDAAARPRRRGCVAD